jgi:hypothetical protein
MLSENTLNRGYVLESLELGAAIDKALSSAFGYGTPAYLRYNEAATFDPTPLLTNLAARAAVSRPVGGPARHDTKVQEARQHFSENKARAIALLQSAIRTLEEEIAEARSETRKSEKSKAEPNTTTEATPEPKSPAKIDVRSAAPRRWAGITFESVRGHVGRWLRRR